MNISLQKIISSGTIQQQNPKADTHPLYNVSFDKVTFDSLMNNFKTEPAGKVPEQSDHHSINNEEQYARRTDEINRREEPAENHHKIDEQKYDNRPDERRKPEETDIPAETDNKEYAYGSGEISENEDQTDQYAEAGGQVRGSGTVVTENDSEPSEDAETDTGNGLKAGALLFAMANNFTGVLKGEAETAVNEENSPADSRGTEQSMKTGALLFDIAKGLTDAGKTAVAEGSDQAGIALKTEAENGLRTGILLKELLKNGSSGPVETQLTGSENAEALKSEQTKSENGIKAGSLLFDKLNGSHGEKHVDETLMNTQLKSAAPEQNDSAKTDNELFKLADKKIDAKQSLIKEFQVKAAVTEADHIEENNVARTLTGKSMSELAENVSRQGGSRNFSGNSSKAVRINTENNNIALSGNSSVIQESRNKSDALNAAKTARPSAFQEIADKITYVVKGGNRIGVTVENATLGKLNINVSMNKGMVNVHINTADSAAREFVEHNINQIIDSLSKNGVSVGGFSVGLRNHGNNEANWNGNAHAHRDHYAGEGKKGIEYVKAGRYAGVNDGMVSVFA